ncbi:putative alkaline shock family protein YloU [Arthrobacter oryzae]|uniref:Asp23/Gls24 family envelope stress response protein n=1 Tax=Arthrobacter TaxID=1663 RepID=UPI001F275404|nr:MULTISPECIES: Asp23/Gls24 family envelope stress response protein [Arthrobacter]MDP9989370.1 putative alkaline shock family protein YloU [Arthrobacter oryzae]UKA71460.1 Asp23/Gls24 family envelope stress response protein [Arthrobacter sp. FW306-06-A]
MSADAGSDVGLGGTPEVGGTTEIADSVVAKIAGIAARRVAGVHALGSSAARAIASLRDAIGQSDDSQGIKVSLDGTEATVQVVLTAEYAFPLHEVAAAVREAVHAALRDWARLTVTDVNVQITDVFAGADDETEAPEAGAGDRTEQ